MGISRRKLLKVAGTVTLATGLSMHRQVLDQGAKIKQKTGIPVGIGLSPEIDTAMAMRALLYSFGGSEQDEHGKLILNSKNTLEALKFAKALYTETMTPEVLAWDATSNNRAMLSGKSSVVLNAI